MYRLSEIEDEVLQRVISNEMATGFLKTFGIKRATEHIEMDEFRLGVIRYLLNTYSENSGLHDLNDTTISEIGHKIEKMYDEILDPEYEYTFDEFGEYLLYIFIRHAYNNFYQAKEIVEYRRLKGPLHNISDLRLLPDFTPEAIQRLEPYLEY